MSQDELHPEEGLVPPVDQEAWLSLLNEDGQLEDDLTLRKVSQLTVLEISFLPISSMFFLTLLLLLFLECYLYDFVDSNSEMFLFRILPWCTL